MLPPVINRGPGMRVAIVENTRITHHGQVGVALHEAGALVEIFRPWADGCLPDVADGHDAIVVFGGEQSALDDATHPYLPALARCMAGFSAADRAVLGICLGSQVLARAFGGANHLGTAPEFGWLQAELTEAGRTDPMLSAASDAFPIFQWHSDTFTLPQSATHLATYGTQFHFEANRAVVADWTRTFPEATERMAAGWATAHPKVSAQLGVQADRTGLQIARAWVGLI